MAGSNIEMAILDGTASELPPLSSKIVRVFLSSTFSDMAVERNVLLKNVYPRLKTYTRERYGASFQVVDMRWGVTNESQNDHMTSTVCLKEIQNCQRVSVGPNFVALIGQKYGYRPIPAFIPADEFETIHQLLEAGGDDLTILDIWYLRDNNAIPPEYVLQPINSILKHYDSEDEDKKKEDRGEWDDCFDEMRKLLKKGADLAFDAGQISGDVKDKYYVSVTEDEIQHGMFQCPDDVNKRCLCFVRTVEDLKDNIDHHRASKFIDLDAAQIEKGYADIDYEAQDMLKLLKESKIPEALQDRNIVRLSTKWSSKGGINEQDNVTYLDQLCMAFYDKMTWLIDENLSQLEELQNDEQKIEILQSLQIRDEWNRIFFGREVEMTKVSKYLNDKNNRRPFAVYGESGCGKTAVIAACAKKTLEVSNKNSAAVLRFLGTSPGSSHILLTLQSICTQISEIYGRFDLVTPSEFTEVVEHFKKVIQLSTTDRPLVIYLDSVDQLSNAFDPHYLQWLPNSLSENTKIVLSFIPDHKDLLDRFSREIVASNTNVAQVKQLGNMLSMEVMHARLKAGDRTITPEQEEIVVSLFSQCSLPLFSRIIVDEISYWSSYKEVTASDVSSTITHSIHRLFRRLELQHGEIFVRRALSYVTAARNGMSEIELLDLLSLDDDVLNAVFQFWMPPMRRIPPFLWTRLKLDLDKFLVSREADDVDVLCWYHRQFAEVARERFLQDDTTRKSVHTNLAEYFLGVWGGGKKKPFIYASFLKARLALTTDVGEEDRNVPLQPLVYCQSKGDIIYNKRKLSELPLHLTKCGNLDTLSSVCIFNYEWLLTKLKVSGLAPLLEDFTMACKTFENSDIQKLADALRIAGSALNSNKDNLGIEIAGRLLDAYDDSPNIQNLVRQADVEGYTDSAVLAPFQLFESPLPALSKTFEGSRADVADIVLMNRKSVLVSISVEGMIKFWNVEKGEVISHFEHEDLKVDSSYMYGLLISRDNKHIVWRNRKHSVGISVFATDTLERLYYHQYYETQIHHLVMVSRDYLCMHNAVFDVATGKKVHDLNDYRKVKSYVNLAITDDEEHILIGGEASVEMFEVNSCKKICTMPVSSPPSDLLIYAARLCIIGQAVDCKIKIFDIRSGSKTFGQEVLEYSPETAFPDHKFLTESNTVKEVSKLKVSNLGLSFICLYNQRYPVLWSVRHASIKPIVMELPGGGNDIKRFFTITYNVDDSFILANDLSSNLWIWSAANGKLITTFPAHTHNIHRLVACSKSNTVYTIGHGDTTIKQWDVNKILKMGLQDKVKSRSISAHSITLSEQNNLVFISRVMPPKSDKAYHYIDHCGVDILDLSTGQTDPLLPFDKYGLFRGLILSKNASTVVFVTGTHYSQGLVHIIDLKERALVESLVVSKCKAVKLSPDGKYLAVFTHDVSFVVRLFSLPKMKELGKYTDCLTGMFTDDCAFVGMTVQREMLIRETIEDDETTRIPLQGDFVSMHYIKNTRMMLLTLNEEGQILARAYKTDGFGMVGMMLGVSKQGICDTASDGSVAVDADLQIFDLCRCRLVKRMHPVGGLPGTEGPVKLSRNGEHVIYVDNRPADCIKVCRVRDSEIVAVCCLHCIPDTVEVFTPSNSIIVVGKDKKVYVLTLQDSERTYLGEVKSYSERAALILGQNHDEFGTAKEYQVSNTVRETLVEKNKVLKMKTMRLKSSSSSRSLTSPTESEESGEKYRPLKEEPKKEERVASSRACIVL